MSIILWFKKLIIKKKGSRTENKKLKNQILTCQNFKY